MLSVSIAKEGRGLKQVETKITVFLSYNRKDEEIVKQIAAGLSKFDDVHAWLDSREIPPGTSYLNLIADALRSCGAVAVFIGTSALGEWQKQELGIAIEQQTRRGIAVIPVFLPGVTEEIIDQVSPFLALNQWVDYRKGGEDAEALNLLRWGITRNKLEPGEPISSPLSSPLEGSPPSGHPNRPPLDSIVSDFAKRLETQNLIFFLGSGVSYREKLKTARACDIAGQLLTDLSIIEQPYEHLLPPVDVAGMYYAVKHGEPELENTVVEMIKKKMLENCSSEIARTHELLAELLKLLKNRPSPRLRAKRKHLIITTNIDVLMERALMKAGIPFTRIVQHRSGKKIDINVYRFELLPQGNAIRFLPEPGLMDPVCELDDNEKLDEKIETYGKPPKEEDADVSPLDKSKLLRYLPIQMDEPILYKFLGSQEIEHSTVLSTLHHFEFAQRVLLENCIPAQITETINNSIILFLGLRFMDPDFRLTYYTLLRKALEMATYLRCALQLHPDTFKEDVYRRMETGMWDPLKDEGMRRFGIKTIEAEDEDFLKKLIDKIQAA